jgi:hypothetical protein
VLQDEKEPNPSKSAAGGTGFRSGPGPFGGSSDGKLAPDGMDWDPQADTWTCLRRWEAEGQASRSDLHMNCTGLLHCTQESTSVSSKNRALIAGFPRALRLPDHGPYRCPFRPQGVPIGLTIALDARSSTRPNELQACRTRSTQPLAMAIGGQRLPMAATRRERLQARPFSARTHASAGERSPRWRRACGHARWPPETRAPQRPRALVSQGQEAAEAGFHARSAAMRAEAEPR